VSALYEDARLKVKRAKKHISDFTTAIIEVEDTCTVTIEDHAQGGQSLIHEIPDVRNALDNLSLIAGDAIHNLRSALDFAWHSTISRLLPDKLSDKTKFPVRQTWENVVDALHGIEVDTRCPKLFECVMQHVQPYKGGPVIWTLHNLDISDKHLLLLGLDPIGHIVGITISDQNGDLSRGSSMPAKGVNGRYIIDFEPGWKVENKGKLDVAVTLQEQESEVFDSVPMESLLSSFCNFTLHTVQLLENI
jgi:hypothetical protein